MGRGVGHLVERDQSQPRRGGAWTAPVPANVSHAMWYGHNGADDTALISQAVGAPIRLEWTRQNEHGWEPLGAAQAHDMKGAVDENGIAAWLHRVYAPTANSRPAADNAGTLPTGQHARGLMPANLPGNAGNSSAATRPSSTRSTTSGSRPGWSRASIRPARRRRRRRRR